MSLPSTEPGLIQNLIGALDGGALEVVDLTAPLSAGIPNGSVTG